MHLDQASAMEVVFDSMQIALNMKRFYTSISMTSQVPQPTCYWQLGNLTNLQLSWIKKQLSPGCSTSRFHGSENEDAGWGEEEEERQGGRKGWSEKIWIKIQHGCSSFGENYILDRGAFIGWTWKLKQMSLSFQTYHALWPYYSVVFNTPKKTVEVMY